MWKVLLGSFGFIFILVIIIAFENIGMQTNFMFLFTVVNRSLFYVVMYMFLFGVMGGILLGLIPYVLAKGKKNNAEMGPDDIDL